MYLYIICKKKKKKQAIKSLKHEPYPQIIQTKYQKWDFKDSRPVFFIVNQT